jgi:hypothetical protein
MDKQRTDGSLPFSAAVWLSDQYVCCLWAHFQDVRLCPTAVVEHITSRERPRPSGSWLVEAESVGDRGRFTATGDPQLGEDP